MAPIAQYLSKIAARFQQAVLLHVGHVVPDPQWGIKAHDHPNHELIVLIHGQMRVEIGGEDLTAAAGDVLLYPVRTPHAESSNPKDPVETLYFSFRMNGVRRNRLIRSRDESGRIRQMMFWLNGIADDCTPYRIEERRALMVAILSEFFRSLEYREGELVARIRNFIRSHLDQTMTLEDLAVQACMSKYHFLRCYRKQAGRTPMDDVRAIRAEYARNLILTTNLPVKEIAVRSGLGNEYSLSRIFRRLYDTAPGQLRRYRPAARL